MILTQNEVKQIKRGEWLNLFVAETVPSLPSSWVCLSHGRGSPCYRSPHGCKVLGKVTNPKQVSVTGPKNLETADQVGAGIIAGVVNIFLQTLLVKKTLMVFFMFPLVVSRNVLLFFTIFPKPETRDPQVEDLKHGELRDPQVEDLKHGELVVRPDR